MLEISPYHKGINITTEITLTTIKLNTRINPY